MTWNRGQEVCQHCLQPVVMMCREGTGFCCERCEEEAAKP